jgi:hypothetical protein
MHYLPPTSSSGSNEPRPNLAEIRLREAELRDYEALQRELLSELRRNPCRRLPAAANGGWVEEVACPTVQSNAISVSEPYILVPQSNHLAMPAACHLMGRPLVLASPSHVNTSCGQRAASGTNPDVGELRSIRRANSAVAPGIVRDGSNGEPNSQPRDMPAESCPTKEVLKRTARPQESLARPKSVHWAPSMRVTSAQQPGILCHSHQREAWTVPFFVQLTICGRQYNVHYATTRSATATVINFEKHLAKAVYREHNETLLAFLKHGYTLKFSFRSRLSRTNIPGEEDAQLRETAIKTFLNAVHKDSKVELC